MSQLISLPGASIVVAFTTNTAITSSLDNTGADGQHLYALGLSGAGWVVQGLPSSTFTVDPTTDIATVTGSNVVTGTGPVQVSTTTTLPAGLAASTNYWLIRVDADHFKFATSYANAIAGTAIDITTAGTGTQTVDTVATVASGALYIPAGGFDIFDGKMGKKLAIIQDSTGGKACLTPLIAAR